jgi:hypothetical protein
LSGGISTDECFDLIGDVSGAKVEGRESDVERDRRVTGLIDELKSFFEI